MRVLSCVDIDLIWGLLVLDLNYIEGSDWMYGLEWFPYNSNDSNVSQVPAYDGVNWWGALIQAEIHVSYRKYYATEGMWLDFADLAVRRFKDKSFDVHRIPSIANQRVFATAEVAEVRQMAVDV